MKTIVIILIYLIGCFLAYGRVYAFKVAYPKINNSTFSKWFVVICSWMGLFIGTLAYFAYHDKKYLRYRKIDVFTTYCVDAICAGCGKDIEITIENELEMDVCSEDCLNIVRHQYNIS